MDSINDTQVGGSHYKSTYQHWDWVERLRLPYMPAQVTKYIYRWKKKNGIEDLKKAQHFLLKFINDESVKAGVQENYTRNFIEENEIETLEAEILIHILNHHNGQLDHLRRANAILINLIDEAQKVK